ncbi:MULTISPECIES: cytochrome c [unclassified Flavobacterium]|uniref:cytochrome c n=1 Tax=unclassified Flavobacterium TaxID=196869 RepID=UPI001F139470|nr:MULTISPECIES: cytochrome c [unclassified Flavobacterium]UMY65188.1 cytochrome c [Flavobacterium sp. HJ-32-4]
MKTLRLLAGCALAAMAVSCGAGKAAPPPPPPPAPAAPLTAQQEEGHQLYENNCGKCHKLFAPNDFSKTEWKPILAEMQPKAKLNNDDMAKIKSYLDVYAK